MPDENDDQGPVVDVPEVVPADPNPYVSLSELTSNSGATVEPVDEPSTDSAEPEPVLMHIAAPWRFSEFRTPAVPGYVLTREWQSFPADIARELYDEATRSGFAVSTSAGFNEGESN